jgi:hypothetical protein
MLQVVCHAWIKSKLGLRQFHVRGLAKAQMEMLWACLTSSCGTRLPPGFLRAAPPNGRAFCCLDNTPVCECMFGNPQTGLRRCGKSSRALSCVVAAESGFCPPDKYSDLSPADRGTRSAKAGSAGWLRAAQTAWPPENRSLVSPSSRYSSAWCSRDRPPSVAVFYSAAVPGDPLLATTASTRWPPVSQPLPQSVHARHPRKSVRCS